MSIETRKLRQILRAQLVTAEGLPPEGRLAWENRSFVPPQIDPEKEPSELLWVRETLLVTNEQQVASDLEQCEGYVQYDVFTPANRGTEAAEDLAKAIKDAFPVPFSITGTEANEGTSLTLYRVRRATGSADGPWWQLPVQAYFRAYGR